MKNTGIAVVIISGGYSSRMGNFKPFLKFGERTAIEMVIGTYRSAGVNNIIVVAGYRGSEIAQKLKSSDTICVYNENYASGMFTSVVKGVKALEADVAAFFMQPVDIPLVKKHTIETLKNKYPISGKGILYPDFCGRIGHPPLVDCKYREAILSSDGQGGLKRILQEHSSDSINVPVPDKAILMDMDTKEDYEKLLGYFNATAPDLDECRRIFDIYGVPENIIRHCRKVSEVSADILHSLGSADHGLDEYTLTAAAMLHDIAKTEKDHAHAGEKILKELGYEMVGSIIGDHTDIEIDDNARITESEVLYLADKLVREDNVIPIEDRFRQSLDKFRDNPKVLKKIENRRDAAFKIIKKIEAVTGKGFIYG